MSDGRPQDLSVLHEIEAVLRARLAERPEGSYSVTLLTDTEQAQRKIIEEAFELCLELGRARPPATDPARVADEAADLVFHVLAGLVGAGVALDDVLDVLAHRRGARR